MELKIGELPDIPAVLELQRQYHINTIQEEDKKDGFVTTAFTKEELQELIEKEQGIFLAIDAGIVIGYVMAGSWSYWSKWAIFAHMIKDLPNLKYQGKVLSTANSYQYGPVCVHKEYRGKGVFQALFNFSREVMSTRFPIMVTFINKINSRSYEAHARKTDLEVVQEFEFNNNHYYELACQTNLA